MPLVDSLCKPMSQLTLEEMSKEERSAIRVTLEPVLSPHLTSHVLLYLRKSAVIFLDIDGVLSAQQDDHTIADRVTEKARALFQPEITDHNVVNSIIRPLQWRIAASYYLGESALTALNSLIERVDDVREVIIVLHSAWREDGTLHQIQTQMFLDHPFAKRILDKTGKGCKEDAIQQWLANNARWNIGSYVVIDDHDYQEDFPNNCVAVDAFYLLRESDREKAVQILLRC